jgi:hypothetical protein
VWTVPRDPSAAWPTTRRLQSIAPCEKLRFLFTTLVVCLPVSLFAAAPLTDFVTAAKNLKLGEAANVTSATWTVGHMTLHFGAGSIAGSEPVGVYFKGSGTFEYRTVEAAERPVVDHNVKAVSHVKMTADANQATLTGDFGDVLILGGGVPMPEVTGNGGAALADARKPFIGIAPGDTVSRRDEGDYNIVENVVDKPVQFTMVEAGKYNLYEQKRGERTIRVATYGLRNERAAKQLTDLADGFISYYEFFLGPFPWKEFNIIQVNDYGFGQAPPAAMFITNEAFSPSLGDEEAQFYTQGINERFSHEIAHQYWAYVVRMPSSEEQWLTEFSQRNALLYNKGPYLLYTIHKEIGVTPFLTFMKSYTKSFNFKFGTTKDVAGILGVITKKDWKPFFEQYFWGTAMPQ